MPQKTRSPKDLGIGDFISFIRELLLWLATQVGDPDYRATLVDGLQAKFDALKAKVVEYENLTELVPEFNKLYTTTGKALHEGLSMLKTMLPSFFPDPAVLGEFSLADPISFDLDDLYITAQACFDHWADVSALPEYAEVAPDFIAVLAKFDDFVAKRDDYEAKFGEMEAAQNDILDLREAVEEQERDLFNYYRAKHPKGDDEFWTETPWGTTGEPESEKLPAVTGFHLVFVDPNLTLAWDAVEGADGYELREGNNPLIMARTIYEGPETEFTYDPPGGHLYFRVWAKKGEEMGEPGDAIDIEIEGNPPGQPQNLQVELQPDGSLRITWDAPPEGSPEYCNLYIKDVETGQPAPTKPSEPYYDEMIVYQITISDPIPGRTYFVWVTAFDDGVEGEPAGPVSVDII